MAGPVGIIAVATAKYGPASIGVGIGTAAKYGLTLTEGKKLTWRGILADILLLSFLVMLAVMIADRFQLDGDMKVMVGALTGASGERVARLVLDRFLKRAERDLAVPIRQTEALAEVGPAAAVNAAPTAAKLTVFRGDPRAAGIEILAEGPLPRTGDEFSALLHQIDQADQPREP